MIVIKIILLYILAYEIYRNFICKPLVRKWRETKTDNEVLREHTTFLALLGLGRILEGIGFVVVCAIWLFFFCK